MAVTLLNTQTTNATSDAFVLSSPKGAVAVSGTFDTATIAIQMSIDGTIWTEAETFTSAGLKVFQFIKRGQVRAVLTSAGGSTSLTVKLEQEY